MVKREENNRFPRRASFEPPCHVDSAPPVRGCREERGEKKKEFFSSSSIFSHSTLVFPPSSRPFCFFPLSLSTYSVELLPNERQESSYPTISFPHLGPRRAPSATRASFFPLSLFLSLLPRLLSARVLLLCRMYIREAMEVPRGQPIASGRTLQPRASAAD